MSENYFDIIIIGTGFRALVTSYLALKKNKKVLIISNSKDLSGVMGPITWKGGSFDKGYQFFDGIDKSQKLFLTKFVGNNLLHDFGYGAATLTNNKILPGHSIPYWPHKGFFYSLKLTISHFLNYRSDIKDRINYAKSYKDLLELLPKITKKFLENECERILGLNSSQVSYSLEKTLPKFCFRQSILPPNISNFLKKKSNYLSSTIATTRNSLKLDCISLYPKGKNIGVASDAMKKKIVDLGVKIINSNETKIFNLENNFIKVKSEKAVFKAKKIYVLTDLDDAVSLFTNKVSETKSIHYLPQIFYYFTSNKIKSKFQYVMNNNINNLVNRANNHSLYGEKTENNKNVISAEVCDNKNEILQKNPEKFIDKVWEELRSMQMVDKIEKISDYKIFKINKTLPIELINYSKTLKNLKLNISRNFNNQIKLPGLGIPFSRSNFLKMVKDEKF